MSKPINEFKKGIIYTSIGTYSGFFLQLIISMILSRLLTPKEYRVVAIVQVFILFFMILFYYKYLSFYIKQFASFV